MKTIYKRIITVILCLALTAALVPATAFARGMPDGLEPGAIVPGRVTVRLKEAYNGDPAELFPYLEIEEIEDLYLSVIITSGKTLEEVGESIREMIGTTFIIELAEVTEKAVYDAIALLTEDERVKYADPDRVVGPDGPGGENNDGNEAPADLFAAFAEYFSVIHHYNASVDKVGLYRAYGWFGGCYLANLHSYDAFVFDDFSAKMIGGYLVDDYQEDDSIILYKDGKAYSLMEAYDGGIISDEAFALVADALNEDAWMYRQSMGDVRYAMIVLRCAAKLNGKHTPMMVERFDLDGDGRITVADALFALRVAAGLA